MRKNTWLPHDDPGKASWLTNFAKELPNFQKILGLPDSVIAQTQNDAENFSFIVNSITVFRTYSNYITTYKNLLRQGSDDGKPLGILSAAPATPVFPQPVTGNIFGRVRKLVQTIKNTEGVYSEYMGKALGIIGTDPEMAADVKPRLTVTFAGGHPQLKYKKMKMQGVRIYVDRGDGAGYVFLDMRTTVKYTDMHPLPASGQSAVWHYKAIFVLNDEEVGSVSDAVSVVVASVL